MDTQIKLRPANMHTLYDYNTQRSSCIVIALKGMLVFECEYDPRSDDSIQTMIDERTAFLDRYSLELVWSD